MEYKWFDGAKDDISDARAVRNEVFVDEQGFTVEIEHDAYDAKALHIVGYEQGKPICTGRLFVEDGHDEGCFHVGRVSVLKQYRGGGIGAEVMMRLYKMATELGGSQIELGAQLSAKQFYEKLGYVQQGDVFLEGGIEHIMMVKEL